MDNMRNKLGLIAYTCAMGYETMNKRVYSLESLKNELIAAHKDLGDFIALLATSAEHEKNQIQDSSTVCYCELCRSFRERS